MHPTWRGKVVQSLVALLPSDGVLVLDPEDDITGLDDLLVAAPGRAGIYLRDPSVRAAAA
jgi:chemotaxis protein methyltransferase CheR